MGAAATRNGQYKKWGAAATRNGQYEKQGAAAKRYGQYKKRGRCRNGSEEHTSELQSHSDLVCRLLLEKKKINKKKTSNLENKLGFNICTPHHTSQ